MTPTGRGMAPPRCLTGARLDDGPQAGCTAEMDALKARVAEVEERLDFAQRRLAQAEQPARLPGRLDS